MLAVEAAEALAVLSCLVSPLVDKQPHEVRTIVDGVTWTHSAAPTSLCYCLLSPLASACWFSDGGLLFSLRICFNCRGGFKDWARCIGVVQNGSGLRWACTNFFNGWFRLSLG